LATPLGTSFVRVVSGASCTISTMFTGSKEGIADPKGPKVADGAGVQDKSAIGMVMEDLDKADQKEVD
jgi:hypothetical protein